MYYLLSQIVFEQYGGIIIAMFFAGLSGGMSHCAGMCGPFVIMQVTQKMDNVNIEKIGIFTRLQGAALLPYHFGRATTYTFIGVASTYLMSNIAQYSVFKWIAFSLLITAAIVMLLSAFGKNNLLASKFNLSIKIPKNIRINFVKMLFQNPTGLRGYMLGVILGFIPCGLVYSAIMVVSSTGNVAVATIGIVIFSLSTIPGLLLVGLGASFTPLNQPIIGKYLVPFFMVFSSLILIYIAGGLLK